MESNEEMQTEEEQETAEDEDSTNDNDNAQNNAENNVEAGSSQKKGTVDAAANLNDSSVDDSDQACPICMEQWTSSGDHRLCCLRCGHLFGYSCILKWLQCSQTSGNRRCPQCKKKATVKQIRLLYARKLISNDNSELEKLKQNLYNVKAEKSQMQMELSTYNIRVKVYEQQVASLRTRIAELESQQSEINVHNQKSLEACVKKFYLNRSIDICKYSGCRVLDYNPSYKSLVVSQKAVNTLFPGHGIRKIDPENFNARQFIFLHSQAIRDLTFHTASSQLLLSVGLDKYAKLIDIPNNMIVHAFQTQYPLWSCCWSGENPNFFLVGAQNGTITWFDIRQISRPVDILYGHGDMSPVVSLATIPPNPGIGGGGFIACRLKTCYVYEAKNSIYMPKQLFLEGPFVAVRYDTRNNHVLISSRPNERQPYAKQTVCTIETNGEEEVVCNIVHTFNAGNSQQLLSRPCHIYTEDDTLVAAYQESSNNITLWSIASGKEFQSIPVSDPIMALCSFKFETNLLLASLTTHKLRLYNYNNGQI